MEREVGILFTTVAAIAAALTYSHLVAAWVRPVWWRLSGLLPVIYLFSQLPFQFSTVHLRGTFAFLLCLTTIKLLLLALHRGPLSPPRLLTLPTFLTLAAFPVDLQRRPPPPPPLIPPLVLYAGKAAVLGLLVSFYPNRHSYPRRAVVALYGLHAYLTLDLMLALCAAVAGALLGPEAALEPPFRAPYMSSSLQDFWSNRWNVMVSRLLHSLVYAPVRSVLGLHAGVVASFLVSGVVHEALFYCSTLERQTGEATCFFLLHGVCVAAEIEVKARLSRRGWRPVPRVVAAPATVGFVTVCAVLLLYPPITRGDAEEKCIAECLAVLRAVGAVVSKASAACLPSPLS